MTIVDDFIEENKFNLDNLNFRKINDKIQLKIPGTKKSFSIDKSQAKKLQANKLIDDIPDIVYYFNYGFSLGDYGEFFLGSEEYPLYDMYGDVSEIDLTFWVGEFYIEFSRVSSLCCLLLEPYYSKKASYIADRGLSEYFYTLKIFNAPQTAHKEIVVKALFYLNSHYLKNIKRPLSIYYIIPKDMMRILLQNRLIMKVKNR